jgi:hypothetical protein
MAVGVLAMLEAPVPMTVAMVFLLLADRRTYARPLWRFRDHPPWIVRIG